MKLKKIFFTQEKDGFNGHYMIICLSTRNQLLKHFLQHHNDEKSIIYHKILKNIHSIIIIKNINIEKKYQAQGYGSYLIKKIINEHNAQAAILVCDVTHNQRFGFNIETFYTLHDFKTIDVYQDYPLMLYPQCLADKIMLYK